MRAALHRYEDTLAVSQEFPLFKYREQLLIDHIQIQTYNLQ